MFKVGDRIILSEILEECPNSWKRSGPQVGYIGTIIHHHTDGQFLIEFTEKFKSGHGGYGEATGKDEHCWNLDLSRYYKIKLMIPNNKLSRVLYPNYIESDCGEYLVKNDERSKIAESIYLEREER